MAQHLRAPSWKQDYLVVQRFRFGGRWYDEGRIVSPRRMDIPRGRLDRLYREGLIALPDADAEEAYRGSEGVRLSQPHALGSDPTGATAPEEPTGWGRKLVLAASGKSAPTAEKPKGWKRFLGLGG